MDSPQRPETVQNLPDDVLSNIFIRLLAKQLAQMRCLSKTWNTLLSESSFVKSHLHRSIHNNNEILLFFSKAFSFDEGIIFTARPSRSPHLELTNFIKLPPVKPQSGIYTRGDVIGSVNGLISFIYRSNYEFVFYIWNPSLSAVLTIPPNPLPFTGYGLICIFPRFGYDPVTDDYKVVKVTGVLRRSRPVIKKWLQVEVYSMRKGLWEIITQRLPSHITMLKDQDEVCVDGHDGHLHWLGETDLEGKPQMIVAFDLGAETFREMLLPDSMSRRFMVLGVWGGKLCVMSNECEVWVMDEYGVVESWVKHSNFLQFGSSSPPYGFTLQNEFLTHDDDYHFALFDPIAGKSKTFEISIPDIFRTHRIVEYVDSLIWVAPTMREMCCCSISRFQFPRTMKCQKNYKRLNIAYNYLFDGYIYVV